MELFPQDWAICLFSSALRYLSSDICYLTSVFLTIDNIRPWAYKMGHLRTYYTITHPVKK